MRIRLTIFFLTGCLFGWAQVRTPPPQPTVRRVSSPISFYEDADISAPGLLNTSQGIDYDRVQAGRDFAFPTSDFSLGLNRWLEVSASLGYARSQFETIHVDGLSDIYIGGKLLVVSERGRRPAFAVKPTLEVLGAASINNNLLAPRRVNFLLPVSVQKSFDSFRTYYTVGYLSRGVFFQSLAYEANWWSRITPTVVLSHSRLTQEVDLVSALGLNQSRTDLLGGVAVTLTPKWSVFGSAGRSVGRLDLNSSRYQISAGVSLNLRLWGAE